jgi:hypothetical protein
MHDPAPKTNRNPPNKERREEMADSGGNAALHQLTQAGQNDGTN